MAGTVQTFLKVLIGANTKGFKKDMGDGEKAVQQFANTTKNSLDRFAEVFGVDLDSARKQLKSVSSGFDVFSKGLKASATGSGLLSGALRVLKTALISTGIGAIIVLIGTLIAYFTKTREGIDKVRQVMASVNAVVETLIQRVAAFGKGIISIFKGNFKEGFQQMGDAFKGVGKEIKQAAENAWDYEKAMQALRDKRMTDEPAISGMLADAEEMIVASKEENKTLNQRLALLRQAKLLIEAANDKEMELAKTERDNAKKALEIPGQMLEKQKTLAEAENKVNEVRRSGASRLKELSSQITGLVNQERELLRIAKEKNDVEKLSLSGAKKIPLEVKELGKMPNYDFYRKNLQAVDSFKQLGLAAIDATSIINDSFNSAAVGLSEFVGALATGQGGFKAFGSLVAGTFADMAINVGKIAIGAGFAVSGIKKALISLNPAVAIAAGVALVALGSAVKGALANASQGGGAASSLAGSGSGGNAFTYDSRLPQTAMVPQKIHVTGELTAPDGKALKAVIDSETNRRNSST